MKTIAELIARRTLLKGIAASSTFGLFGCAAGRSGEAVDGSAPLTFAEIGRTKDDKAHVSPGHDVQILIRHGDPIRRGGPAFRPGQQTGAEQEQQFGSDNDFLAFMPMPRGSNSSARGLLGVNHENHRAAQVWPDMTSAAKMTREYCEVSMAAQGFSIVEIEKAGSSWRVIDDSKYNRRISANTPMRASGPAAGHPRMRTRDDPSGTRPVGTFNNCAGGVTLWNTILTAEENIQFYFLGDQSKGPEAAARKRYNIGSVVRYPWGRYFDRFNIDQEPNEPNRFGWVVEIDPFDPQSTPVKRTALGRFSHECATCALSHDGRVAVYSGDDARGEFVYKFVTRDRAAGGKDLLDNGTLYVARCRCCTARGR
jgi:secreted PhoX family phosphatase